MEISQKIFIANLSWEHPEYISQNAFACLTSSRKRYSHILSQKISRGIRTHVLRRLVKAVQSLVVKLVRMASFTKSHIPWDFVGYVKSVANLSKVPLVFATKLQVMQIDFSEIVIIHKIHGIWRFVKLFVIVGHEKQKLHG